MSQSLTGSGWLILKQRSEARQAGLSLAMGSLRELGLYQIMFDFVKHSVDAMFQVPG